MKYYLIITQIIFLYSGLLGQESPSILGETYVCPGDTELYEIYDERCATISSAEWDITFGNDTYFGIVDAREVTWDDSGESNGVVSVSYICVPTGGGDPIAVDDLTLDVEIRQIQLPLFDEDFVEHPLGDNSSFPISTINQGENFIYSWTFPDCLPGSDGLHYTSINPDMYGIGTVCLTVYDNQCGKEVTDCIEVKRSCEDIITYSASDEIPFFTSVDLQINTSGIVIPTLPYVEFKAGETIVLNPGFTANPEFYAHIGDCGRSPDAEGCIGPSTTELVGGINIIDMLESLNSKSDQANEYEMESPKLRNDFEMTIFPNPTSDYATITINDFDLFRKLSYEILSLNGQVLVKGQLSGQQTSVDIGSFSKGIYLVKVYSSNNLSIERLVKY